MNDDAGAREEIARLQQRLAEADAKRAVLLEDIVHLVAHLPEIRKAFGNPFFYSHPEEPDEGIANYTGNGSHTIGMSTLSALRRVDRELERIRAELRRLGHDDTTP